MNKEDVIATIAQHIVDSTPHPGSASVNPSAESTLQHLANALGIGDEVEKLAEQIFSTKEIFTWHETYSKLNIILLSYIDKMELFKVLRSLGISFKEAGAMLSALHNKNSACHDKLSHLSHWEAGEIKKRLAGVAKIELKKV